MAKPCSSVLVIERREPELIPPSKSTPYEFKLLSNIDDQKSYWKHLTLIQMYAKNKKEKMEGRDPIKVIRKAIADTLVHYYPLAGRLREGRNGKLMVECNEEGVLFIEADARLSLDVIAGVLLPPFPAADELLCQPPGSEGILHCPLVLIQVTRFICGGFTFACRCNHTMCDITGLVQFLIAIGELARGAHIPLVKPVWKRELLSVGDPPRILSPNHAYHALLDSKKKKPSLDSNNINNLTQASFFFSKQDLSTIRNYANNIACSNFDVLTAFMWRTRTIALNLDPNEVVCVGFPVSIRKSMLNPPLPVGYYGNALTASVALSTVSELCQKSLRYAVDLVIKAKNSANKEFMRSTIDFLAKNSRPSVSNVRTFIVSDLTKIKFKDIDFGMGTCLYGGRLHEGDTKSFIIEKNNGDDQHGVVFMIGLPKPAMEKFVLEIEKTLLPKVPYNFRVSTSILSSL